MSKQRHTNIEIHTYLQKESEKKERINVLRRAALHQNHAFLKALYKILERQYIF